MNPGPPPRKGSLCAPLARFSDLGELLEAFRAWCVASRGNSRRTLEDQLNALTRVVKRLDDLHDRPLIVARLAELPPGPRGHAIKALKKLAHFLDWPDLAKGLRVPKFSPRRYQIPPNEELARFEEALERARDRLAFRLLADSGLRKHEVLELRVGDIILEERCLMPHHDSPTKKPGISFFTSEAEPLLREWLEELAPDGPEARLFPYKSDIWLRKAFKRAGKATGVAVCPQMLRVRFADKCGEAEIPDRYVDIMQGRAPQTVLARHYTPSGIKRLKRHYTKVEPLLLLRS